MFIVRMPFLIVVNGMNLFLSPLFAPAESKHVRKFNQKTHFFEKKRVHTKMPK
jgi:hypothetical protein